MSKSDKPSNGSVSLDTLSENINELSVLQRQTNKLAKKRNKIQRKQHQQSLLDFEQAERMYLIEKSKLQPSFRLSASEILTCEPDFVNDPEQASEASFLKARGVGLDHRVLRLSLIVKGNNEYMHPNIVYCADNEAQFSGLAHSMSETTYFISLGETEFNNPIQKMTLYLVYRDKTTLPVIHKYRLIKQIKSTLQRWEASQIDTVYGKTNSASLLLQSYDECEQLFSLKG